MFKTVYAVCIPTYRASSYTIAICETEEDAKVIKQFVDSCLKTLSTIPENIRRHKDAELLIYDAPYEFDTTFGSRMNLDISTGSYIEKKEYNRVWKG